MRDCRENNVNGSLKLHETYCDKCDGTGANYQQSVAELLTRWRKSLGINQRRMAALTKISFTELSKFENGRLDFGQARIRRIIQILEISSGEKEGL